MYVKVTSLDPGKSSEVAAWSERVAAVIVERQAAFGRIISQLVAFYRAPSTSVAAGTIAVQYRVSSVVSVASFATGASLLRHGNGDGLRLAHACIRCRSRCMPEGSRLYLDDWQVIEVAAWSERVAARHRWASSCLRSASSTSW
ncbi:hypothetical protein O9993_05615 [Vibrio lentus]|nr:hypothetical protein [Vibrio lentus]